MSPSTTEAPDVTAVALDGAAIVQMLKPGSAKTFSEYAHSVFIPHIMATYRGDVSRVDLVWDQYIPNSLKQTTRSRRGRGVRRRVVSEGKIPGNWHSFLRVDENKTELSVFLSDALLRSFTSTENMWLIVTYGNMVRSKPDIPVRQESQLALCPHEEADSRIFLHAAHAADHGHSKLMIRTVDTDIVVLAVSVVQDLPTDVQLWVKFGTGTHTGYIAAHELAHRLKPEKAKVLPLFHALTGCE